MYIALDNCLFACPMCPYGGSGAGDGSNTICAITRANVGYEGESTPEDTHSLNP